MVKKKNPVTLYLIVFIILIISLIMALSNIDNQLEGCYPKIEKCYKTECTVWSCGRINVDVTSPQCETKYVTCG